LQPTGNLAEEFILVTQEEKEDAASCVLKQEVLDTYVNVSLDSYCYATEDHAGEFILVPQEREEVALSYA